MLSYSNFAGGDTATRWCAKRYVKTFSGYWFVWVLSAVICQLIDGRTVRFLLQDGGYRGFLYGMIDFFGLARLFDAPTLEFNWWYMSAAFVFILLTPLLQRAKDELWLLLMGLVALLRVLNGGSGRTFFPGLVRYMLSCRRSCLARYLHGMDCLNGGCPLAVESAGRRSAS